MELNQRTLLFLLIVFIILITLFHKNLNIKNKNLNLLLLGILLAIFIFYNKFINGRLEQFYEKHSSVEGFNTEREPINNLLDIIKFFKNLAPHIFEINKNLERIKNTINSDRNNIQSINVNNQLESNRRNEPSINSELKSEFNNKFNEIMNDMEIPNNLNEVKELFNNKIDSLQVIVDKIIEDSNTSDEKRQNLKNYISNITTNMNLLNTKIDELLKSDGPNTQSEINNLKKLYLNKSEYHVTNTKDNPLIKLKTTDSEVNTEDAEKQSNNLMKNKLNYNFDAENSEYTTDSAKINGNFLTNLLHFNYATTDDLITNITKRSYDFNIVNLDSNADNNAVEQSNEQSLVQVTGDVDVDAEQSQTTSYSVPLLNGENTQSETSPQTEISNVTYTRRVINTPKDNTSTSATDGNDEEENDEEDNDEEDNDEEENDEEENDEEENDEEENDEEENDEEEQASIQRKLFEKRKKNNNNKGLDGFINMFFTAINDIFN